MSETKLLDSNGLAHFWQRISELYWKGTQAEFDALQDELRAGTIVHITDDYEDVTTYITNVTVNIDGSLTFTLSDGTTITQSGSGTQVSGIIYEGTINDETLGTNNTYTSTITYAKQGAVVTLYIDIEANLPNQTNFTFNNTVPATIRPYKQINSLVAESANNFNNISINEDGEISCSSITGVYRIKTAITYVLVNSSEHEENG